MARQFRDEAGRLEALGLTTAEIAFYDALANNKSAQKLRQNLTIDWQYKENVRARLRTMIKALLKRYKYPPDQEATAIELVLRQTEVISEEWAREDLGNQIQAAVAEALAKNFSVADTEETR
jgi:type I restriction enzyme R subunit